MNTNNSIKNELLLVKPDGTTIKFEAGSLEIVNERNIEETYYDDIYEVSHNTFSLTFKKIAPLTRKKFIKILMSKGIQRNGANEIAKYTLRKKGTYDITDLFLW